MGVLQDALMLAGGGVISLVGAGGKTSLMFRLAAELAAAGERVLTTTTTRIFRPRYDQSRRVLLAEGADEVLERAKTLPGAERHLTAAAGVGDDSQKLVGFAPGVIDRLAAAGVFRWVIVEADGAAGRSLKAPAAHEPVIPGTTGWMVVVAGLAAVGRPLAGDHVFRPEVFARLSGLAPGEPIDAAAVAAVLGHPQGGVKGAPAGCRRLVFLNQADTPERVAAALQVAAILRKGPRGGLERVVCGRLLAASPVAAVHDLNA